MDSGWLTLGLVVAMLVLLYSWVTRNLDYWAKRGVPFIKPLPIVGNLSSTALGKENMNLRVEKMYYEMKQHKMGGVFFFMSPALIITDPELIKEFTVKYFDYFTDRVTFFTRKSDPLFARSLFGLKGNEWRAMRNRLSPAFTTSKLKTMFPLITQCGEQFARFLLQQRGEPLEFKAAFTRLTNDVIASVAFGVEGGAIEDPTAKFFCYAQKMMQFKGLRMIKFLMFMTMPKLMCALGFSVIEGNSTSYFKDLVRTNMEYRERTGETRPDMLQLLMEAQKGEISRTKGDEKDAVTLGEDETAAEQHQKHLQEHSGDSTLITEDDIAAQAFLFFAAGFDTVSTVMAFSAYELTINSDVQERLRDEIDAAILENGGKFNYESVQKMKYLDMVICEVLRKYPPAGSTDRVCTKNFKVPGTDMLIEEGTQLMIPIYPLHRDPEYFTNPEKFQPDRFSEENSKKIRPYTYLPFGSGPHNCIGMRLAMLEVKLALCYILATCELQVTPKTEVPLQLSKLTFQMTTDAGFWLAAHPRNNPSISLE